MLIELVVVAGLGAGWYFKKLPVPGFVSDINAGLAVGYLQEWFPQYDIKSLLSDERVKEMFTNTEYQDPRVIAAQKAAEKAAAEAKITKKIDWDTTGYAIDGKSLLGTDYTQTVTFPKECIHLGDETDLLKSDLILPGSDVEYVMLFDHNTDKDILASAVASVKEALNVDITKYVDVAEAVGDNVGRDGFYGVVIYDVAKNAISQQYRIMTGDEPTLLITKKTSDGRYAYELFRITSGKPGSYVSDSIGMLGEKLRNGKIVYNSSGEVNEVLKKALGAAAG